MDWQSDLCSTFQYVGVYDGQGEWGRSCYSSLNRWQVLAKWLGIAIEFVAGISLPSCVGSATDGGNFHLANWHRAEAVDPT